MPFCAMEDDMGESILKWNESSHFRETALQVFFSLLPQIGQTTATFQKISKIKNILYVKTNEIRIYG